MTDKLFGVDTGKRTDVPSGLRRSGVTGGKGIFDKYFNQIIFEQNQDHVLGSASQLALNDCTMKWNGSNFVDKDDVTVSFLDYDRIVVTGSDVLAANMTLPTVSGLRMRSFNGAQLQLGTNAGDGNAPFKMILSSTATKCDIDIETDKPFEDLAFSLTDDQKRHFSNQGSKNKVSVNGINIYDPMHAGEIVQLDSYPLNPYLVRMNGQQLNFKLHATPASNNTLAWFRDLNILMNGYRDGSEVASRFTLPAVISASPHLFQVNTPNGILRDISIADPDIHARTDSNGVSIAATCDFVNASSTVTIQTSVGNIKNWMRIRGATAQGIPDETGGGATSPGTTILVDIDETAKTATMIDALTRSAVTATSTASQAVVFDNSGALGGSLQQDAAQKITGQTRAYAQSSVLNAGALTAALYLSSGGPTAGATSRYEIQFDNSQSVSPNAAKTNDDETRIKSTDVYIFYRG